VPENTIPEFLEAVGAIASEFPVVIVGSSGYGGDLDEEVRALADSHENVRWYGHLSDDRKLLSLWQHAGVYFHGHSVGGTNPTLVQAMATRTPIVARDTVYNREVLGEGGVFVPPDPRTIAKAVLALMKNPAEQERRSSASFERSRGVYTWESVCEKYDLELSKLREAREGSTSKSRSDVRD
jgi:glycosyltransferase involved in cell wall biosynthesis